MTEGARWIGALAALALALTGCGGSHHDPAAAGAPQEAARLATSSTKATAAVRPGPSANAIALPLSSAGPTTCTIYEPGSGTQIVFDSRSLNVRVECQLWASSRPGDGYLWGYERARTPESTRVCSLTDPQRKLTASVIEQNDFVPVSAQDRATGRSACASIVAAGWVKRTR